MNTFAKFVGSVGGPSAAARMLGVSVQAVCFWRDGKRKLPAEICPTIEKISSGKFLCEDLKPTVEWSVVAERCKEVAHG